MQGVLCSVAASVAHCNRQSSRRTFAGRQLRSAVSNGARCRAFFNFGKKDKKESVVDNNPEYFVGSKRDDYQASDVEEYFMYMGMLAAEGNYDRCEQMLASGTPPIDLLLLMASSEGDDGKVAELLESGANPDVKDPEGRTPMDLAKKEEVKELLRKAKVPA